MTEQGRQSAVDVQHASVRAERGGFVHVWWSDEGVSIATDLGDGEAGTLVHVSRGAAAYLAGALTVAAGVALDGSAERSSSPSRSKPSANGSNEGEA